MGMATQTTALTGKAGSKSSPATASVTTEKTPLSDRVVGWVKAHRQTASWLGAIVAVGAVLFVWRMSTRRRAEGIAGRELEGGRAGLENQRLPLPPAARGEGDGK